MNDVLKDIKKLFEEFKNDIPERIEKLPPSGSDRIYFRIYYGDETFIATHNLNVKENKTFIYFSKHFREKGLLVPEIFKLNEEGTIYIQQDLGTTSLLDNLEENSHGEYIFNLFKKSLKQLARMQIKGDEGLDYNQCLTAKQFGKQAIFSDLLYFKYYFLDTLKLPYDKQTIIDDFEALSNYLSESDHQYFMFRDFQSRNIMIDENDDVHFIDYQGGMKGALQYDVASLLWQAKAALSKDWKESLLKYYISEINHLLKQSINETDFISTESIFSLFDFNSAKTSVTSRSKSVNPRIAKSFLSILFSIVGVGCRYRMILYS